MNQHRRLPAILIATTLAAGAALAQAPAPAKRPSDAGKSAAAPYPAALLKPATLTAQAPEEFEVKFETTKGDFVVKVTRAWAPLGADRFYNLVGNKFYDGAAFFRVVREPQPFVVQFGLSAFPEVSKAWSGAAIQDDPVTKRNTRGFVTYAMGGPNTRTTQLFINLADNSRLDANGFSPFGEVTHGMDVVDQLYGGYGEGAPRGNGPSQGLIQAQGKAYLEKDFPLLDTIKVARIVAPAPPAPPAKKAPAKKQP